ncbi:MAG: hypothetical protein NVS3B26_22070 [Mycobacteriales bacterium]
MKAPDPMGSNSQTSEMRDPSPVSAPPSTRPTRTSSLWVAVVGFVVVLLLLAVFLLQNGQHVHVAYLGTGAQLPLAVAMLLSALAGALLVATAGIARVLQLRHSVRQQRKDTSG